MGDYTERSFFFDEIEKALARYDRHFDRDTREGVERLIGEARRGWDMEDELYEKHEKLKKEYEQLRSDFARAYNALRNIRLYLRKHVDDIPYECRETLKRFCDAGGVTDTVLRASSSDLADVAFPPQE